MNLSVRSPTQIAWVTPDLDATEAALTGLLGARKWVRIPDVHFAPDSCSYRGKPADFVASISLSYLGDMQLELISPVRGENIYSDFLRDCGPGLHHICLEVEGPEQLEIALAEAADHGASVVQRGSMPGEFSSPTSRHHRRGCRLWKLRTSRRKSRRFMTTSNGSSVEHRDTSDG